MNQTVYSGYNSCDQLLSVLKQFSPKNIFLVTGKKSFSTSGASEQFKKILTDFKVTVFSDYLPNPHIEDVEKGVRLFRESRCDLVLAIGGGTPIDLGKSIALLATQEGNIQDFIKTGKGLTPRKIPCLTIPTTAGTGSEATHFSVIYINKVKYSLSQGSMLPDCAILDPTFTLNLPPGVTASSSMDALSQAIESFWSVKSTEESRRYSQEAIELILANIIANFKNPDRQTKENMLWGSHLAGKAINIAQTTAAHAFSYPMTSYFDIPHGHAVALTLPYVLEINNQITSENIQDRRGIGFVQETMKKLDSFFGAPDYKTTMTKLISIMRDLQLERSLAKLGVPPEGLEVIIQNGFNPDRIKNNPRIISRADFSVILHKLLQ